MFAMTHINDIKRAMARNLPSAKRTIVFLEDPDDEEDLTSSDDDDGDCFDSSPRKFTDNRRYPCVDDYFLDICNDGDTSVWDQACTNSIDSLLTKLNATQDEKDRFHERFNVEVDSATFEDMDVV
ncbi:hypothetical protein HK102_001221 [Quaeritorhiza haematococci]|nr:hypothetical protein HK102_001221 [Quaeritorhiza haematococci]